MMNVEDAGKPQAYRKIPAGAPAGTKQRAVRPHYEKGRASPAFLF